MRYFFNFFGLCSGMRLDPSVSVARALLGGFSWARYARSGAGRVDPRDSAVVWCGVPLCSWQPCMASLLEGLGVGEWRVECAISAVEWVR